MLSKVSNISITDFVYLSLAYSPLFILNKQITVHKRERSLSLFFAEHIRIFELINIILTITFLI